ncbi:hypothetical protein SCHPADRAFT_817392 [Schizopora paradoxa]|uniref:F-box domain-containing protein n=1 Tax=Schizopora paradoxa TaxID=27342 RepID=A0A0H2S7M7_9AGAM|nr:hypothetical protein SCHPADRAFT_817392 [Schizopora paradoxa]
MTNAAISFDSLPVELVADILGVVDLKSLIILSCLSRRLRQICADPALNPWRGPILRNLRSEGAVYEDAFRNLSVFSTVPRNNWIEILSIARAEYLLFQASLPVLSESDWQVCFRRRFLPDWARWKGEGRWKELFLKMLYKVVHRMSISCTAEEAWTKFIVLNRNGSANLLSSTSRSFNPLVLFNEMKIQNNLAHLETRIRVVVEFADVRIIALGVLNNPRSPLSINNNARAFLHPPGLRRDDEQDDSGSASTGVLEDELASKLANMNLSGLDDHVYEPLSYPLPSTSFANYPFFTPGGKDKRWSGSGTLEEQGRHWVGGMLLTAQLISENTRHHAIQQEHDIVNGPGLSSYASFTWVDLEAIAPWMSDLITKRIDGQGLGH